MGSSVDWNQTKSRHKIDLQTVGKITGYLNGKNSNHV